MALRSRRTVYYLGLVVATTVVFTAVYNAGMASWEGRPQPLYRSLEVVIQSFTTTGYGEDAPWQTPQMHLLVILMQFAGIGLILTAADVFAVPWLREALAPTAPVAVSDAENHVIICAHTSRTEAFISELDARDRDYVLVEPDPTAAADLHEAGYQVIQGDPESTETLANARIDTAIAVVADVADDANASIALAARDARQDSRVITLVEDATLARYHRAAGVATVLSPRQLLGRSLAAQLPTAVTTDIEEGVRVGDDFELVELAVAADSDLRGRTVAESGLRERFGVNVIGAWFESDFQTPVDTWSVIDAGTRLLVAGEVSNVDALRRVAGTTVRDFSPQQVVLAGFGDSGRATYEALAETSSELTVLDVDADDDVDVVGDARDPAVLQAADIETASALVVTVSDDTTAIFTTLIARELNPALQIVVRANEEADVEKLRRAGADYVQSLATVSGRMLASTVFEDEELLAYDAQLSVVRLPARGLAGTTLADAGVRTVTDSTVVAVIRDDEAITDFDPATFTFEPDDEVVIAGPDEGVSQFERRFVD